MGRQLIIHDMVIAEKIDVAITSLKRLLLCLDDPRPLQALMVLLVDLPKPASVAASAHAANVPVMLALNHTSLGYVHVVPVHAKHFDPLKLIHDFMLFKSINSLGIFIIMPLEHDLKLKIVAYLYTVLFKRFGTTRVVYLSTNKEPSVLISNGYNQVAKVLSVTRHTLTDFCSKQLDVRTKKLQLNTEVGNLKGFRFEYIVREQNVWVDKRGHTRIGGRDVEFAKLLEEFGMVWKPCDLDFETNHALIEGNLELILPASKLSIVWNLEDVVPAQYSVVSEQVIQL
ncbi:hypothetical protein R5R35_001618 [Gryllus longicercus]|uniref:Uncharacterized protein n=1 Tax=Gryllus longicercus TaxID=2509291 RepID=A0AAN9Z512_9ORTH